MTLRVIRPTRLEPNQFQMLEGTIPPLLEIILVHYRDTTNCNANTFCRGGGGKQYQSKVPNRITQHDVEYRALATTLPLAEIQKFPQQLPLPIFTRGRERSDVRVKDNALKLNRKTQPEFEPTPLSLVPSTQATGPTPLKAHTRLY